MPQNGGCSPQGLLHCHCHPKCPLAALTPTAQSQRRQLPMGQLVTEIHHPDGDICLEGQPQASSHSSHHTTTEYSPARESPPVWKWPVLGHSCNAVSLLPTRQEWAEIPLFSDPIPLVAWDPYKFGISVVCSSKLLATTAVF